LWPCKKSYIYDPITNMCIKFQIFPNPVVLKNI